MYFCQYTMFVIGIVEYRIRGKIPKWLNVKHLWMCLK